MKHLPRNWLALAAICLPAIAAWPTIGAQHANASRAYVAPVLPDYKNRDATIAFYERRVAQDRKDQISAKLLASQYMQRYRETQDVADILRGISQAQRSLKLEPQNNSGAFEIAASGYTALHQFRTALQYEAAARIEQPDDSNPPAQMASLNMELGNYAAAAANLAIARHIKETPTVLSVEARYEELTGHLAQARVLLQRAAAQIDEVADNSAQARAWYHFRMGELAFSAGDTDEAKAQEHIAIRDFPSFESAYRALARFCWATKEWRCALDSATAGSRIIPEPETLGYEADAQRALGNNHAAQETQLLIYAVQRIGNAYHINDRLLAMYFAEHGVRLDDAYRIAQREVRVRGSEIYAQDTLAWCAAMNGRWEVARTAAREATRYNTQDARIQFHAGMIALHFGRIAQARKNLSTALKLNPWFDPFYADEARARLRQLGAT